LGYILGDFFSNTSGHPGPKRFLLNSRTESLSEGGSVFSDANFLAGNFFGGKLAVVIFKTYLLVKLFSIDVLFELWNSDSLKFWCHFILGK
jgi:hypothetical protein